MARSILVTGAAGFIGSNFVRWWLERHPDDHVVALDKLTYAGDPRNLDGLGVRLAVCDICDLDPTERLLAEEQIDTVVNFAAESHNSLAVLDPGLFFRTNVLGTQALLEASRRQGVSRFHHVSTCEVYGDLPLDSGDAFSEESPYRPGAVLKLLDLPRGLWHLAGDGDCTWAELAEAIFEESGIDCPVRRITTAELEWPAPRPAYSVLRSERPDAPSLPHWREGLRACLERLSA